jgi:hypothetical protein
VDYATSDVTATAPATTLLHPERSRSLRGDDETVPIAVQGDR